MMDLRINPVIEAPFISVKPLLTVGGAVQTAAVGPTALNIVDAARFAYLVRVEAICVLAGAAAGEFTLFNSDGVTVIAKWAQPVAAAVVNTRYVWDFEVPFKTLVKNGAFQIGYSAANIGTWRWHVYGLLSSL